MYTKKWYLINGLLWLGVAGFVMLILFILECAPGGTQPPTHDYKLSWIPNSENDMSHYTLYAWNGSDTLSTPFIEGQPGTLYSAYILKDFIPHRFGMTIMRDTVAYVANGNWIQMALAAVDTAGNRSGIAVSNFLKSADKVFPAMPDSFVIKK